LFGVNPWRLQAWMDHKRIDETMLYVHVAETHARELPEEIRAASIGEADVLRSRRVAQEAQRDDRRLPGTEDARSIAGDAGNATGPSVFKRCSDKQGGGALSAKRLLLYNDRCTVTLAVRRTNLEKG
jgi:hypothetical protein